MNHTFLSDESLIFTKNQRFETSLHLAFTNELIGVKTRSILYGENSILFSEKFATEIQNKSLALPDKQYACNNISDYQINKTLTQNMKNYSSLFLLEIRE